MHTAYYAELFVIVCRLGFAFAKYLHIFTFAFISFHLYAMLLLYKLGSLPPSNTSDSKPIDKSSHNLKLFDLRVLTLALFFFDNCYWMAAIENFRLASYYVRSPLLAYIAFNLPLPLLCTHFYFVNWLCISLSCGQYCNTWSKPLWAWQCLGW